MTKIMLVEDDKSLREIYGVRLLAEGYDIVSAGDGEEALAMAIKERPQLIVSDVMMPKISGFDMLDILHSTTETKNIKVIMMTALSTEEQRQRGEALGADRYLVKSQVGIEDVVRVVHEVLEDKPGVAAPATTPTPTAAASAGVPLPPPIPAPAAPVAPAAPAPSHTTLNVPTAHLPSPGVGVPPPAPAAPVHTPPPTPKPASIKTRIIQPLNNPMSGGVDLNELLDKEIAKEAGISEDNRPAVASTDQEKALVEAQLSNFGTTPELPPADAAPNESGIPGVEISSEGTLVSDGNPAAPTEDKKPDAPAPTATA
jgi:CheY-like chemotaxis protein